MVFEINLGSFLYLWTFRKGKILNMSELRVKEYEELLFTDDFMFCKVLENNEALCKELLELILGKKICRINYLAKQKVIDITSDGKGIRLDVYLEDDENTVFDIEMQTTPNKNLPKRTRYYQGMIDLNLIEKGSDYKELKKSYIIFICMQNPFKKRELHLYSFENRCNEDASLFLDDESTKVILTPDGTADDVSDELAEFLDYLAGKGGTSPFVKRLNEAVEQARNKEMWRMEYMTLQMRDREKFEEGMQQGRIDAIQRMICKGCTKEFIFDLGYTEEEYAEAESKLIQA